MGTTTTNGVLRAGAGSNKNTLKGSAVLSVATKGLTAADLPYSVYLPPKIFLSTLTVVASGATALPTAGTVDLNLYSDDGVTLDKAVSDETVVSAAGVAGIASDAMWVDSGKSMLVISEGDVAVTADLEFHLRISYYQHDSKYGAA